jgi:hypothetical protein
MYRDDRTSTSATFKYVNLIIGSCIVYHTKSYKVVRAAIRSGSCMNHVASLVLDSLPIGG